ncbi:2-hydroxyacid dehydrogenase [Curvivirga sp.]|uniref:2-hydroxyacid dehydrogenase n=1 Tax=Curvivirga sp. TaxID=2856848 RepID=UPI003B595396
MGKPKIFATRRFPADVEKRLFASYDVVMNDNDQPLDISDYAKYADKCDGLMISPTEKMDQAAINTLPDSIKIISTFSVGYDHIDVAAATARDIIITNTPDVLTDATADIAMLCMLGAARQAQASEKSLREGGWGRWMPSGYLGTHMSGKRLGILGMGSIGQAVARRAKGFDMPIHYHNRRPVEGADDLGAIYHDSVESLLAASDFLSINCPLTESTHHLINEDRISLMPDGAVLVNTARGPVIKDTDVIAALKSGKLAAAGLDVFEGEPNINPEYLTLDNVFLVPHIGSATVETRNDMGFKCLDNLDAFFAGTKLPSQVSL